MSLAGCQINPIGVNFYFQKSLEIFDEKSAAKNLIQKGKGVESMVSNNIKDFDYIQTDIYH